MKPNLHAFFKDAMKMEFAAGGYQHSDHENETENILQKNGFKKSFDNCCANNILGATITIV